MKFHVPIEAAAAGIFVAAGLTYLAVRIRYLGFSDLTPWDTGWYNAIARYSYTFDGNYGIEQKEAFFPLHPMLVRGLNALTGLPFWAAQIACSIGLSAAGGAVLARAATQSMAPRYVGMGLFLIAFSPFAIFLYNGYSESAYFFASALLLYGLTARPRLGVAVVAVILASLARPWGILAGLVLAACLLRTWAARPDDPALTFNGILLALCLSASGFIGITFYFLWKFGDPLLFMHAASVWDAAPIGFRQGVLTADGVLYGLGKFRDTAFNSLAIGVVLYLCAIAVTALARRQLPREWFIFVAIHATAFYFITYWSPHGVQNAGRYALLLYPAAFYALVIFRRIDEGISAAGVADGGGHRRFGEGQPLPVLGYLLALPFVALFLRYAAEFVNGKWIS